ncbi:MAG: class I SAM-dependent methyltransferase [Chromatiales bacterium]
MTASASCPLCQIPAPLRLRKSGFAIHRCEKSDFEFVHPTPPADVIARVYAREYFTGEGHGYADYFEQERPANLRKAAQRLDRLAQLGITGSARLLDVGCADGVFVEAALARGLDAHGVEQSPEALAAVPKGLQNRVYSSIEKASEWGPWSAITLWDVLEHLPDFLGTLRALRVELAPSGVLAVVVPVIDNANARYLPSTWDQYKPPEHLWYFSRKSLRDVLEREVGAVVLEESAWRREARILDVAPAAAGAAAKNALTRAARGIERRLWRSAVAARLLAPERLDDSVAMYALACRYARDAFRPSCPRNALA